jgi:hypothetical protein
MLPAVELTFVSKLTHTGAHAKPTPPCPGERA